MTRCAICKTNERDYLWQPFGPAETADLFAFPGWQYRGFATVPVCKSCSEKIKSGARIEFTYKKINLVCENLKVEAAK